ncbi:MAG TPA: DUF4384 domain-containing protein [Steroidobacteraceae bacterium]|nr:DUF4384 domain-containing protein [Steroidobacteraceae bacterium]
MVHRGRLLSPAVVLLCALICHPAGARSVALLVAVGQFSDPNLKAHQLLGPPIDIDSMQRALSEHWGFSPGDIVSLRDQDATHDHILEQIAALEARSAPGDTVFIYFSGHGTSANDNDNNFDLPYATGAWVPYDLDYSSTAAAQRTLIVGRRDLVPRLKRLDQGGRWVVVVSDSCYSGQVVRSFGQAFSRSRFLPMLTRDLGVARAPATVSARPQPPPYPYQHVLLLSGASDSETGADISTSQALQQAPTLDGKFHGAFTDAFLRLLYGQLLPGAFNYAQGREAMNIFLEHRNFAQHPQLLPAIAEDPQDIGSRPFLGMNAPGQPSAPAAVAPARDATLHLKLESVSAALKGKIAALSGVAMVDRDGDLSLRQNGDQVELRGPAGDPIVTTTAGDPKLIKRIAAQAWLNRVLPAGDGSLGLRAETDPGSRGNTYVQCESFVFEVRLQRAAYVMVLDLDSEGNLTVLYPTRPSERQIIAGGVPRAIPSADPKDHILVTAPFGSDQVAVLAFEKLPDFFADLTGVQRFASDGGRADALAKGIAAAAGAVGVQQITVHTYPATGKVFCGS